MDNIREEYRKISTPNKIGFWVILIIGISLASYSGLIAQKIFFPDTLTSFFVYLIPLILSMFAFLSAGLVLTGRTTLSVWCTLGSNWIGMIIITILAEGYGLTPAIWILLLGILVASQFLSGRMLIMMLVLSILSANITIVIDLFWFLERMKVSSLEANVATYIAIGMGLVLVLFLIVRFQQFPIRTKLIIGFLSLTFVSVGVIITQGLAINSRYLTESIGKNMQEQSEAKASVLGNELSRLVGVLLSLTFDSTLQESLLNNIQTYNSETDIKDQVNSLDKRWRYALESDRNDPLIYDRLTNKTTINLRFINSRIQSLGDMFLTDRYGALVGATTIKDKYDFSNEEWWQKTYNEGDGSIYIGLPIYDEATATITILIAVPVYDRAGNYISGVLCTQFPFEILKKKMVADLEKLGPNANVDILFPSVPLSMYVGSVEISNPMMEASSYATKALELAETQEYFQMLYGERESLVSVAEVSDINNNDYIQQLGWKVVIHNPTEDILAPIESQRRRSIVILQVTSVLSTIVALGLARIIANPLLRLSDVAQRFGKGDFNVIAQSNTEDEIGILAATFNQMAEQIRQILAGLEYQVSERTKAIVTSAEVSRRLSTILDQKQLLLSVVEEIQRAFDFYHVQIYLFDKSKQYLVMVGGTGEAGQTMMAREHKIEQGRGLVGRAAETKSVVLVPDTISDENWLPNPLLPETLSEVAVPIMVGEQVLGVLDVQHNVRKGLTYEIADLLQSIANQVAIAVQNSRLYSTAQRQADREALLLSINQKIQNETSIENVLRIAAHELGQALSLKRALIQVNSNPTGFSGSVDTGNETP
jgi:GAF domain-containing protein/HAMP domain-containing protein